MSNVTIVKATRLVNHLLLLHVQSITVGVYKQIYVYHTPQEELTDMYHGLYHAMSFCSIDPCVYGM
jgi:hypothetical protein